MSVKEGSIALIHMEKDMRTKWIEMCTGITCCHVFHVFHPFIVVILLQNHKKMGIYMKNRTFKKKVIKLDNFKILGYSDLQGHVTTLKVQKINLGQKINQKKKKFDTL